MYSVLGDKAMACAGGVENADPQAARPLAQRRLPTGDLLPRITVQSVQGAQTVWSMDLDTVEDDLESRYLAAKGDDMHFSLDVPGKGVVDGVLWCAPADSAHLRSRAVSVCELSSSDRSMPPLSKRDLLPAQKRARTH